MDISDHIPQGPEAVGFDELVRDAIEFGDMETAGGILTREFQTFMSDYVDDETIFGLVKIANHVVVMNTEGLNCIFDVRRKRLCLPYTVAMRITSMHDLACLLLVERNRLIVGRSVHVYAPPDLDLTQVSHKAIYDLALSCWAIALSRCFCGSILPERLYAPFQDMFSNLMHGLMPDQFSEAIVDKFPNVAKVYLQLYNMGGQEQYHSNLNRVASGNTSTLPFVYVLEAFWEDFKKNAPTNEDIEKIIKALLAMNEGDGEEERPANNQSSQRAAQKKSRSDGGGLEATPTVDIDVETDLDQHLSQFMRVAIHGIGGRYDMFHGMSSLSPSVDKIRAGFDSLQHTVTLESNSNEDDGMFGSIFPPDHPTTRDLSMYMQGYTPMLWETRMSSASSEQADIRYDAYFDISGSMDRWFPVVRALLRNLGVYIRPNQVFGFSTQVAEIDMGASYLLTTGGTDISCAIKHARSRGVKHVLLITDLEDYREINTEGIEHLLIVATDCASDIEVSKTLFRNHDKNTKVDIYPVNFEELVTQSPAMGSFNKSNMGGVNCEDDEIDF